MRHLGDFDTSTIVYGKFTTYRPSTGATFTLGGTPALSVYKDNSTTQSTTGVTLTADFDSVTGLNHYAIDTSADGTFYSAGSFFDVVITTGTVDSVSVVGAVVGSFTIRKNSALKPTTAGRTLDVTAGGEAGIDWANIGSPTTTVNLSGTTVKTATDVETDTADIQARLPAALVSGRMDSSVGAMAANVMTAAAAAADLTTELQSGLATAASITALDGKIDIIDGNVDSILVDTAVIGTPAGASVSADIAAIKAETASILTDTAEIGAAGAGLTALASAANLATVAGYIDTEVAAIKAKTDNLPSDPADASDIAALIDALPTASENATAVRTELTTELGRLDAAVSTRATPAQVNAEMVDALSTDTYAEPGQGNPAATASLATKIGFLYKAWRNKTTQTASEYALYADDGTTKDQEATVSDDGTTFERGEVSTGA